MCFWIYNGRWFDRAGWRNQAIDWAYQLDQTYPEHRLVAVGQSPAWMVHLAGYIREQQGRPNNTTIIPFSGNFLGRDRDDRVKYPANPFLPAFRPTVDQPEVTPEAQKLWPREPVVSAYFTHLAGLNAAPENIVADARRGLKTVFIDAGETFKGIASFAALYLKDADHKGILGDLMQSMQFHLYDVNSTLPESTIHLTDDNRHTYDLPVAVHQMNSHERFVISLVATCNSLGDTSSRLAEYYDLTDPDPHIKKASNAARVSEIRGILEEQVRLRAQRAAPSPPAPQP